MQAHAHFSPLGRMIRSHQETEPLAYSGESAVNQKTPCQGYSSEINGYNM